ncbi:Tigger transposable element-derived protein 7 [Chionoecetes opilio]|uniref:Tigger transposable element-derived protein 7 n=1 Tax=Chionoecetes opilio TaxID=41210 RepID=A0A8J5CLY4_CHIOP|nr:Tigger transposable element-derived protein 7 [Chionoecetes opilio]
MGTRGEVKHTTLSNAWKKLIKDEDLELDFHGFEASDFHSILYKAGENVVTLDDVHEWIEENEAAEGHEILSEEQIVAAVTGGQSSDSEGSDVEQPQTVKMSEIREYADKLLPYVANATRHTSRNITTSYACSVQKLLWSSTRLAVNRKLILSSSHELLSCLLLNQAPASLPPPSRLLLKQALTFSCQLTCSSTRLQWWYSVTDGCCV